MTLTTASEQNIIERDVHCPYCQSDKAVLISGLAEKTSTLQMPGTRVYLLKLVFTFFGALLTSGFKLIEKKRSYKYITYGFCPNCGKSYNAGVPASIETKAASRPKLYKSKNQKKLKGVCGGIAEYTELPVKVVRLSMVLWNIGGIIMYLLFNWVCDDNPNQ